MLYTIDNKFAKDGNYTHFCTECGNVWYDKNKDPGVCTCGAKAAEGTLVPDGGCTMKVHEPDIRRVDGGYEGTNTCVKLSMEHYGSTRIYRMDKEVYQIQIRNDPLEIHIYENGEEKSLCKTNITKALKWLTYSDFPAGCIFREFYDISMSKVTDAALRLLEQPWMLTFYRAGDETFSLYQMCQNSDFKDMDRGQKDLPHMLKLSEKMVDFLLNFCVLLNSYGVELDYIRRLLKLFPEDDIMDGLVEMIQVYEDDDYRKGRVVLDYIGLLLHYGPDLEPIPLAKYLNDQRQHGFGSYLSCIKALNKYLEFAVTLKKDFSFYPDDLSMVQHFIDCRMTAQDILDADKMLSDPKVKEKEFVGEEYSILVPENMLQVLKDMGTIGSNVKFEWPSGMVFRMLKNDYSALVQAMIYVDGNEIQNIRTSCSSFKLTQAQIQTIIDWAAQNKMTYGEKVQYNLFGGKKPR